MRDARINSWTAAYEADMLQIVLVVNCLANRIGKTASNLAGFGSLETEVHVIFSGLTYPFTVRLSVSGERGERLVLVDCLIKPDSGLKSKLPVCSSTKY